MPPKACIAGPWKESRQVGSPLAQAMKEPGPVAVMGGADGIAAHIFQDFDLMPEGRNADRRPQRAQVVVHADTLEFHRLPVEEESLPVNEFGLADAEDGHLFVQQFPAGINGGDGLVKVFLWIFQMIRKKVVL